MQALGMLAKAGGIRAAGTFANTGAVHVQQVRGITQGAWLGTSTVGGRYWHILCNVSLRDNNMMKLTTQLK